MYCLYLIIKFRWKLIIIIIIINITNITNINHQKEEFEKQFIINALKMFNGRINQTVAHAGIPKNTLLRKMKKYGINPKEFGATDAELVETE